MQYAFSSAHQLQPDEGTVSYNIFSQQGFKAEQAVCQESPTVTSRSADSSIPSVIAGLFLLLGCCCVALWLREHRSRRSYPGFIQKSVSMVDLSNLKQLKHTPSSAQLPLTQDSDVKASAGLDSLHKKLVGLLAGDRAAATRLLQRACALHSDQTEQWCYEKAIQDLLRDRQ